MSAKIHPLTGAPINGKARKELVEFFAAQKKRREIHARYDAAQDGDEYKNIWAAADSFDADSANSKAVRQKIVPRSRYEIGNNGYADGIAQTYATDLVGIGPKLRMQTGSTGFNQMIEAQWGLWAKVVQFRRKLWCQAHAKLSDGEGIGIARTNPGIRHPVKLDYVLYETEQIQTPYLPILIDGYIDGIRFDEFGNPVWYDVLRRHPGSSIGFATQLNLVPEQVPAEFVMHWFCMRRPGQHRGIPECSSTLNIGAAFRRLREANLSTAEKIAAWTLFLKTIFAPDELDVVTPMSTIDIQHSMMTALPNSVEPFQLKAEHPGPTYDAFHRSLLNEQARPKSMPYNKAACDSSSYNYASGRLDHQTYYGALDVDREDGNDLVLDPLFDIWFSEAIRQFGWLGGDPRAVGPGARSHSWDWPKHRVADIVAEAQEKDIKLKNGSTSLDAVYSECGEDYEDRLISQAAANGISSDQQRQINLLLNVSKDALPYVAKILGLQPATPAPAAIGGPSANPA